MENKKRSCNLTLIHFSFLIAIILTAGMIIKGNAYAEGVLRETSHDWPMWRYDAGRTAASPHELPRELNLQWIRELKEPARAWPQQEDDGDKLAFDVSYEPIAYDGLLLVPSMAEDSLTAYDMSSGKEQWRFYANGPVRFAPAAADGRVHFVSDDGCLYTVEARTGRLIWRHRGAPIDRRVIGNQRLISAWPARGGAVIKDGVVYYAAGIWPFMGVFIYGIEAETGRVKWENSSSGAAYVSQPHAHGNFGGAAPQGYLAAEGDVLIVPNGRSRPGGYSRESGELLYLNISSRQFGRGWPGQGGYAVMVKDGYFHFTGETNRLSDGKLKSQARLPGLEVVDAQSGRAPELNRWPLIDMAAAGDEGIIGVADGKLSVYAHQPDKERAESEPCGRGRTADYYPLRKIRTAEVDAKVDEVFIQAGKFLYAGGPNGEILEIEIPEQGENTAAAAKIGVVEGKIWNMIAASGKLIVITEEGRIYCYGEENTKPLIYEREIVEFAVSHADAENVGADDADSILRRKNAHGGGYAVLAGGSDGRLLEKLLAESEMHFVVLESEGDRADQLRHALSEAGLYGDRAVVHEAGLDNFTLPPYVADLIVIESLEGSGMLNDKAYVEKLYEALRPYGGAACIISGSEDSERFKSLVRNARLENAVVERENGITFLVRQGALPGADGWTHQNANPANTLVSGDELVKPPLGLLWFGGPSNENVLPRHGRGPIPQVSGGRLYILGPHSLGARCVYTGRLLWEKNLPGIGKPFDTTAHQPGADHVGSPYVCMEDAVYIFHNNACLKLEPATGEVIKEFRVPRSDGNGYAGWGYLGVWDDFLIAGLEPHYFDGRTPGGDNWNATSSERIVVMDRYNGEIKWERKAVFGFRHNAIAAAKGKLYIMDRLSDGVLQPLRRRGVEKPDSRMMAVKIRNGEKIWELNESIFGEWLGYSKEHDILLQAGRPATNSRQEIPDQVNDRLAAYDAASGTLLWETYETYNNPPILHEREESIIVHGKAFDLLTGSRKTREHPLTGEETPYTYHSRSNCGQIIAGKHLATFRRGSGSYLDLANDAGTANLGGFRAGCTPNLVPADGVLAAPDYTRECICAYQMQTSLGLVHMPDLEYWTINAFERRRSTVRRGGINFGAPGDRRSPEGTMWLVYPGIGELGGMSDEFQLFESYIRIRTPPGHLPISVNPEHPGWLRFQRHSMLLDDTTNGWIYGSGLKGVKEIEVSLVSRAGEDGTYTVRLYFAEPGEAEPGERLFDISVQGEKVLRGFDIAEEGGGGWRGVVREFNGVAVENKLSIILEQTQDSDFPSVISGIEVIAE